MSHWLDGLFDSGGITIEWNGTELADAPILAFGEQFEVENSTERNVVSIRFITLEGDVTGDSDENRVTTISGDEEEGRVDMECTSLVWDPSASEGEPAIRVSSGELDGGALEVIHNGERVILLAASGVEIGGDEVESINQLIGGLRVTRQLINTTPVTLDATTTSILLVIDASLERTVNMPPPSTGRVFFWVLVGGTSAITLGRGAALINGAASNYTPPNNSRGIVWSDGVDWYTLAGVA